MERLGIYGGTFNPPHLGHRHAAEEFIKAASLDRLLVVPTYIPPHKAADDIASAEDRLAMCRLAFDGLCNTVISDYEISMKRTSYTYMTLEHFSSSDRKLFFLVGDDMFMTLDSWKKAETIFGLATIVCVRRYEEGTEELEARADEYRSEYGADIIISQAEPYVAGSTGIREDRDGIREHVCDGVGEYILSHGLYV